jgi:hypothetical protein
MPGLDAESVRAAKSHPAPASLGPHLFTLDFPSVERLWQSVASGPNDSANVLERRLWLSAAGLS